MNLLQTILKLDFLQGKKTYILGLLMVIHGGATILLDVLNGKPAEQMATIEFFNGLGFIGLRKAI